MMSLRLIEIAHFPPKRQPRFPPPSPLSPSPNREIVPRERPVRQPNRVDPFELLLDLSLETGAGGETVRMFQRDSPARPLLRQPRRLDLSEQIVVVCIDRFDRFVDVDAPLADVHQRVAWIGRDDRSVIGR
jgi:hypothetical protein